MKISGALLHDIAHDCGAAFGGSVERDALHAHLAEPRAALQRWQEAGFAADMQYMRRDPALFATLETVLPGARSLVSLLFPYAQGADATPLPLGHGRVARYARGRDYHSVLREKLATFVARVERELGRSTRWRGFTDAVPILERAAANRAGLGFLGKNTLLIRAGAGSYFFIADIVWELEVDEPETPLSRYLRRGKPPGTGCGSCTRCLRSCPTGALPQPGVLDARRCISYLTIEKRGAFSPTERALIGDWIFGCDICQEVCPFNHGAGALEVLPEFQPAAGAGNSLDLRGVLELSSPAAFRQRYGATALARTGYAGLVRNACAVAANTGAAFLAEQLLSRTESDPLESLRLAAQDALGVMAGELTPWQRERLNRCLLREQTRAH